MKFLVIDIGVGTQDILYYDTNDTIENAIKLVLPSPTKIIAEKIRKHHHNILLSGETMGGGPVNRAIKSHLEKGYKVITTEKAARTIRDDLDQVKAMGIDITSRNEKHPETAEIKLGDIDIPLLRDTLHKYDIELDFDYIGVAVQDHGFLKGMGDREFRMKTIKANLNKTRLVEEFAYFKEVPEYFSRMNGVLNILKEYKPIIMDSKFAALSGALCDPIVKKMDKFIALDVGNSHTMAASFCSGKICGIFEHHTRMLNPQKIRIYLEKLMRGTLTHQEIHNDGGHGAYIIEPIEKFESLVATGPQRKMLEGTDLPVHYAVPGGDVMMAGPIGLINAIMHERK